MQLSETRQQLNTSHFLNHSLIYINNDHDQPIRLLENLVFLRKKKRNAIDGFYVGKIEIYFNVLTLY